VSDRNPIYLNCYTLIGLEVTNSFENRNPEVVKLARGAVSECLVVLSMLLVYVHCDEAYFT
jgi:hypothetical protein